MRIPDGQHLNVLLRSAIGNVSMLFFYLSAMYASISTVTVIKTLYSLFLAFFCFLLLNERLSRLDLINLIVSFGGVFMYVIPNVLEEEEGNEEVRSVAAAQMFGALLALVHTVGSALAHSFLRKMNQGMHYILSPFYLGLFGVFFGGSCIAVVGSTLYVFYWRKTALLCGAIFLLWIGQVTMSVAY